MQSRFIAVSITAATLGAAALAPTTAMACSSCGCFLNTDWASQGYTVSEGVRFDLRYDYYNQNQLREGTGKFDAGSVTYPNEREVQQSTINRNLNLAFDYSPSRDWGWNMLLPVIDRTHSTIAEGDVDVSRSWSRGIGDIRVTGRYQGFDDMALGIQFGLKLPTGRTDVNFAEGPQAGNPLDRGLQPGTGTTDALIGIYHFGMLDDNTSYFANATAQLPMNSRNDFRPGAALSINAGLRYVSGGGIEPQLQLNARSEGRESGANADVENSGSTVVNLSPGIAMPLGARVQAYAFAQVPVYQRVNGLQIEPRYTISVGIRWALQ